LLPYVCIFVPSAFYPNPGRQLILKNTISVEQVARFTGHRAAVFALAEAGQPQTFYSADGNGWVVAWNVQDPDEGRLLAQVPSNVFSMRYLAGFGLLALGSMSGALYFIDLAQNRVIDPPIQLDKAVFCLEQCGNTLFAGTGGGLLWAINLPQLSAQQVSPICNSSIRSAHLHPNLPLLALGCSNHEIYLFNTQTRQAVPQTAFHQNSVFSVRFTPNGQYLLSGSRDAFLAIWQLQTAQTPQLQLLHSIPAHLFTINSIACPPNTGWFATASRDKTIKIWHSDNYSLLKVIDQTKTGITAHKNSVNNLLWLPHNNLLLSAGDDRQIFAWQVSGIG